MDDTSCQEGYAYENHTVGIGLHACPQEEQDYEHGGYLPVELVLRFTPQPADEEQGQGIEQQ